MRIALTVGLVSILTLLGSVHAETNPPAFHVATNQAGLERLMQINAERAKRGEAPNPVQVSPELDEQLVAGGTLPPSEGGDGLVGLEFKNTPLPFVAEQYADYTGKKVVIDKDVSTGRSTALSLAVDKLMKKAEAAALIEKALADSGLVVVPVGTNTVRISRKNNDK